MVSFILYSYEYNYKRERLADNSNFNIFSYATSPFPLAQILSLISIKNNYNTKKKRNKLWKKYPKRVNECEGGQKGVKGGGWCGVGSNPRVREMAHTIPPDSPPFAFSFLLLVLIILLSPLRILVTPRQSNVTCYCHCPCQPMQITHNFLVFVSLLIKPTLR